MAIITKSSIIEYEKNSELSQLTEGDCLRSDAKKMSPVKNLNCIMNEVNKFVATQFLTHVFDIFSKNPKIEKNKENPKKYVFLIYFRHFSIFNVV